MNCPRLINLFLCRSTGGIEAEQAMRIKLNEEEQKKILDSVNALIEIRRKKNAHIAPSSLAGDGDRVESTGEKKSTTSLIISKDYYDQFDSSDDSVDESITSPDNLVSEISRISDSECDDNSGMK